MFNIGFGELAVICIVLIIAVGPERLPSMMKTLGKTIRTLRQASRDIRASTGIDELMREDFDLYAPIKNPPRRPAPLPAPAPEPAALPAAGTVPTTPAASVQGETETATEPQTVSREEMLEPENTGDRPSVVVAPPPQSIGLPSDEPAPVPAPAPPPPAAIAAAEPAAASGNGAPIASNVDTLPRAPIVQTAAPAASPDPKPEAANTDSDSKQSGA